MPSPKPDFFPVNPPPPGSVYVSLYVRTMLNCSVVWGLLKLVMGTRKDRKCSENTFLPITLTRNNRNIFFGIVLPIFCVSDRAEIVAPKQIQSPAHARPLCLGVHTHVLCTAHSGIRHREPRRRSVPREEHGSVSGVFQPPVTQKTIRSHRKHRKPQQCDVIPITPSTLSLTSSPVCVPGHRIHTQPDTGAVNRA